MEQEVMQAIRAELESNIDANTGNFTALLFRDRTVGFLVSAFRFRDGLQKRQQETTMKFIPNSLIRKSMRSFWSAEWWSATEGWPVKNRRQNWTLCADDQQLGNLWQLLCNVPFYEERPGVLVWISAEMAEKQPGIWNPVWCCVSAGLFYQRSVYRCCAGGDEKDSSRWLLRKNGRRLGSIDLLYSFPEKTQKLLKENSLRWLDT